MAPKKVIAPTKIIDAVQENSFILFLRPNYHILASFVWIPILILRFVPGFEFLELQRFTELSYYDPTRSGSLETNHFEIKSQKRTVTFFLLIEGVVFYLGK